MEFKFIIKKLNHTLTPEEEKVFEAWLKESKEHQDYFRKVKKGFSQNVFAVDVDKGWEAIENRIKSTTTNKTIRSHRKIALWKYVAAASLLILLGVSGYFGFLNIFSKHAKAKMASREVNAVTLTLKDGTKIALGKGKSYHLDNMYGTNDKITYKYCLTPRQIGYNILTVPKGTQFKLILSDGTKIWLNSDTRIKYPNEFVEGELRKVELLYGEAYFKVSPSTLHNNSRFQVLTGRQKVEVLGTEFNIKAYKGSNRIVTTLIKGIIRIENGSAKKIMKPNYQAIVTTGNPAIALHQVSTFDITAWRKGLFSFEKISLYEITKVLSRWYDVRFVFLNQNAKELKYTGILDRKLKLETILSILEKTNDVKYERKGKTIYIK